MRITKTIKIAFIFLHVRLCACCFYPDVAIRQRSIHLLIHLIP